MNFRDGFRVEPAHILAQLGTRSGMVSGRSTLNLREITTKTTCVAKCCTRQKCTHQIEASWEAEKILTTTNFPPSEPLGPRYPTDWPLVPPQAWA